MGFRWVLNDPVVPESDIFAAGANTSGTPSTYTFDINPNKGGSPQLEKALSIYATTADNSVMVFYEGSDTPQVVTVSGTLLSEGQYNAMVYWYSKRRQVSLTDDLGRVMWVYFATFSPDRKWSYQNPWRHDWSATFYVFGQQGVTAL